MRKTKVKAAKSPKKPHTEPSHAGSAGNKRTGRTPRKSATATAGSGTGPGTGTSEGSDEVEGSNSDTIKIPGRVVWDKYPERTERLLSFLDANTDVALKLFGDSTQLANTEGRSKVTAKSSKATAYLQVANGVFSIDENPGVRSDFKTNPNKYAKAVDNYITNT
jgi:hypothetical protein